MIYQIEVMNALKRFLPLTLRRFLKRIALSFSLTTRLPIWVFFAAGSRKSPSSGRKRHSFKAKSRADKQKKKHFLILVPWVVGGGSSQMIHELIRHLSKKGFSFSLRYTREPGDQIGRLEPYTLDIAPLFLTWKNRENESLVNALLGEHQYSGVLLIDIDPDSFFFLPHFKKLSLPIINWLHFHTDALKPYHQFISNMERFINHFVVVNREMKQLLLSERYHVYHARVTVIGNGIDTNQFDPTLFDDKRKALLLNKFGVPRGKPIVSFISRFDEAKNPLGVVKIFEKILYSHPDTYIVMAGDGHLLKKTKRKAVETGLTDHVRFVGFQDDIRPLLTITSVLIAPSISESFGLSPAEAMAMEVPVVVSNVGGLKKLVGSGIHGYRLDPSDYEGFAKRAVELIKNRKKGRSFGKAARKRIKDEFPLTKMVNRFEKLLNKIGND